MIQIDLAGRILRFTARFLTRAMLWACSQAYVIALHFLSGFVLLRNCVRIPRKLTVGLKTQVKPCVSFIAESVLWKHTGELRIAWILLKIYWASQVTEVMRSELLLMLPANSKTRGPLDAFRGTLCALLKSRSKCFANIQWMNIIHIQPVYIWIDMFKKQFL